MPRFPAFNPFVFPDAVCIQCGMVMEKEIVRGPQNRVDHVVYRCQNAETGCDYEIASDIRLTGMMQIPSKEHASR
jgi:hypothetical protein